MNKVIENHEIINGLDADYQKTKLELKNEFPIDVLPSFYKQLIIDLKMTLGYQYDYTGASLFFVISTVIGNKIKLKYKTGWIEGSNVYQILVGKPGDGKSHALSFMLEPIHKIEKDLYKRYQLEKAEYDRDSNSENSIPKPELIQFIVDDSTPEAVLKIHSLNKKAIGVCVDEIMGFLNAFNKYRNGNDEELYLSAFSGKSIKVTRTTKETIRIDNPHISIIGSIQPKVINRAFTGKKQDNGFLHRFLFYWPDKLVRSKWNLKEINKSVVERYENEIKELFHFIEGVGDSIILKFESEAIDYLLNWQNNNQKKSESDFEEGVVVKLEQYVLRFCILLHVLRNYSNSHLPSIIDLNIVKDAIILYDYFKETADKVYEQINSSHFDNLNERQKKLFQLLPEQFKTGDGVRIAIDNELISERGFKNFIKDKKLFRKIGYGVYEKLIF